MKVLQFSTPTCGPCISAKAYIEKAYTEEFRNKNYEYINANLAGSEELDLFRAFPGNRVPKFVVVDENRKPVDYWGGFNPMQVKDNFDKIFNQNISDAEEE